MRESLEQQKKLLYDRHGAPSVNNRHQVLYRLRKRNILMYRQLGRLKHDLLRLELGHIQHELEGSQTQVEAVETEILKKKE